MASNPPTIVIHWPRFGPYHIARLEAAAALFKEHGYQIAGLELFTGEDEYLWQHIDRVQGLTQHTLFPGKSPREIRGPALFKKIWCYLDAVNPCVIAINGYSSWDSLCILCWCRVRERLAILMSDSKYDDAHREIFREQLKKVIIGQFGAALCGGKPHRQYLTHLNMSPDIIFDGYDVVDNQFFMAYANQVRNSPDDFHLFPGLEDHQPFFLASGRFIPRKNFLGLVHAYNRYKDLCSQMNQIPWRLVILGDGPQQEDIRLTIERRHLREDITLAGIRTYNELPTYYGMAQAFIHPALQDQWGLVVNEAMASGLPVLVSHQAGCARDLVEPGIEGYLFNPRDPVELADLMYLLSIKFPDREIMGKAAQTKIIAWGPDRFAMNLLNAVTLGTRL